MKVTKEQVATWFAVLAIASAVAALILGWVLFARKTDALREGHIESSENGEYLTTPAASRVYKFYDEVGAVCFVAETEGGQAIAIDCMEGK